jgi:hypothetical protein
VPSFGQTNWLGHCNGDGIALLPSVAGRQAFQQACDCPCQSCPCCSSVCRSASPPICCNATAQCSLRLVATKPCSVAVMVTAGSCCSRANQVHNWSLQHGSGVHCRWCLCHTMHRHARSKVCCSQCPPRNTNGRAYLRESDVCRAADARHIVGKRSDLAPSTNWTQRGKGALSIRAYHCPVSGMPPMCDESHLVGVIGDMPFAPILRTPPAPIPTV